ncbi:MAG: 6-phosphogluconolactonase [Anaerolineae bacterium]
MTHPRIFSTVTELGQHAAQLLADAAAQAVAGRGRFVVAISGGSLPGIIAPPLLAEPLRSRLPWPACHLFFADERCVPLDDPESNYRLVREQLLNRLPVPPGQIYPIDPALSPAAAAEVYAAQLRRIFGDAPAPPRFDAVLLGMGPDGHTASLFPGHPLLAEHTRWVAPITNSPKPPPRRITLTLPLLNAARLVIFIATGSNKAEVLPRVLLPNATLPAGLVRPASGQLHWLVDAAAAAGLSN